MKGSEAGALPVGPLSQERGGIAPSQPTGRRIDLTDKASLKRRAALLDALLVKRPTISDKVLFQAELGYMRRQLIADRRTVNVTYPVNPPFAFVQIRFDEDAGEFRYDALEPTLVEGEKEQIAKIREKMEAMMAQEELPLSTSLNLEDSNELRDYLQQRFLAVLDLYDIEVPVRRRQVYLYYLHREFVGLGRTDAVLRDPFLEDISCLGPGVPLFVFHRVFGSVRTNVIYDSELELNKYVFRLAQIAGKHVSVYQPILDATLRDGSRINLTLGTEVTRKGSTFSIRKFSADPVSPVDLIRFGSLSAAEFAYFWTLVENHRSLLISGGTASGKTTLLNAITMFVRPEDKIVSIEDTPEIHIDHQNWIQSVARTGYGIASGVGGASGISGVSGGQPKAAGSVTLFDLLVSALRQRPEYVIVGEVRGVESFTLFQAISVGHASMSTIHAGSIGELLHRIENEPMNIPRVLFQALDTVAFPAQVTVKQSRVRRLTSIVEVLEIDPTSNELLTNEVFKWDPVVDKFNFTGRSFVLEKIGKMSGRSIETFETEMKRKETYLRLMAQLGMNYYKDVSRAIAAYYVDPEAALLHLQKKSAAS
jgi:archaeal flagellar protein FlaI